MNDAKSFVEPFASAAAPDSKARIEAAVAGNYEFLWRCLRRLGVHEPAVEDALQKVLIIFAERVGGIADGAERAFLFGTAVRVASDFRKKAARSREVSDNEAILARCDAAPTAEGLLDERRARRILDLALAEMPMDLRTVFVLSELEEMTLASIAKLLGIPGGTAASRLRRARVCFAAIAREMQARLRADEEVGSP